MKAMSMLGAVVEVTSGGGVDRVIVDPLMPMLISALFLFLILLPILFILGIVYHKKKFQHEQILAAMEKGIPISDLVAKPTPRDKEINWVRSLSAGIGFMFIGAVLALLWVWMKEAPGVTSMDPKFLIIPVITGGIGLIYLTRGLLQRGCEKNKDVAEQHHKELVQS